MGVLSKQNDIQLRFEIQVNLVMIRESIYFLTLFFF